MGYVIMGHGGLDLAQGSSGPGMEYVGIPAGTTIQYYCDAGQDLDYRSAELDRWERLRAPWPVLDCTNVTYNFTLTDAEELWGEEFRNNPRLGGHTVIRPGIDDFPRRIRLCMGSPSSCPTSARQVAAGWTHRCRGILGLLRGDLHWLACTGFTDVEPTVLDAVLDGRPESVVLGRAGGGMLLVPREEDHWLIAEVNRATLERAADGETQECRGGDSLFLIGPDHDSTYEQHALAAPDGFVATLTVHKPDGAPLHLTATGIPPAAADDVRNCSRRLVGISLSLT